LSIDYINSNAMPFSLSNVERMYPYIFWVPWAFPYTMYATRANRPNYENPI